MAKVTWFGHACWLVEGSPVEGETIRVVMDPHDGACVGLKKPEVAAEIVLVSHSHFDHNHPDVVKGYQKVIDKPGSYNVGNFHVKGVPAKHDEKGGSLRGDNIVFVFELDGIKFCHAGDLGHTFTEEQIEKIGKVNVLFVPVGGVYTVDAKGATVVTKQLKPNIVIPMHYKLPGLSVGIGSLEPFLTGKKVKKAGSNTVSITKNELPAETEVLVFEYLP